MALSSATIVILNISEQYPTYASLTMFIIGIIGHSLNLLVWSKHKIFRNNQRIFYFIFESIVDICQLINYFTTRMLYVISETDLAKASPIWCKLREIIGQTLLLLSLCSICFISFDQFLSTSYIFYLRQTRTLKLVQRLIIIAVCLSLCHSIPAGLFFEAKLTIACAVYQPMLIRYYSYFFYPLLTGLFPILITSIFSMLAYRNVRQIIRRQIPIVQRRLDLQLTAMTLVRIVCFNILCTSYLVYMIYSMNVTIESSDSKRLAIEQLVKVIINSVYYFNYAVSLRFKTN
jgi:hypothetical protein